MSRAVNPSARSECRIWLRIAVHAAVRKMVYQGQCRDKLAVLCKMAFKRRSEIARAEPGFEILASFIKNVLGVFVETKVRNRREFIGCRAGSARRQFIQSPESLPRRRAWL